MTLYTYHAVCDLMNRYINNGGTVYELEDGCLVQGLTVCECDGWKTAIIKEVYLNEWSSGQSVRFYNKTPKKYEKMISDHITAYEHYEDYLEEWYENHDEGFPACFEEWRDNEYREK